jgi:RNA polymerase sigma-70 factor, ECF subfamily
MTFGSVQSARAAQDHTRDAVATVSSVGLSTSELVALHLDDLRAMAAAQMRGERAEHTLQPTALAHEAFLRLSGEPGTPEDGGAAGPAGGLWHDKAHFLFAASVAIRRILIDHARARNSVKRGGGLRRDMLDEAVLAAGDSVADGLGCDPSDLDGALEELKELHPRPAAVVQMRFFGGVTEARIAMMLGVTERTVRKDWALARAWLHRRLRTGDCG